MKLVIAEKPSVAKAIATVLNANERKDGFFIGSGYVVTWCVGHLLELAYADAYDEKYKKWRQEDLPILPRQWKTAVPKDKAKQLKTIQSLMNRADVDTIVCATDAGREGELIFRLVYEHCGCQKPIKRLWISSMEERAILDGFQNLRDGTEYENLYRASLCRARADWLVGINATRLFTLLYGQTLNVGRVQTPTLALVVERAAAIRQFEPRPFYTVELALDGFTVKSKKLEDKSTADAIHAVCSGQSAAVQKVDRQEKNTVPPKLYDLTTLQREANRLHGFTAQQTLDYAQSLYEKKLLTYPRTDSQYLTADMAGTVEKLAAYLGGNMAFAQDQKIAPEPAKVLDDAKVTDHHAIIPTLGAVGTDLSALPAGETMLFNLVAARLLYATAPPHRYEAVKVVVSCGGHNFTATGKTVLSDGWKSIEAAFLTELRDKPAKESVAEKPLPQLAQNQQFTDVAATVRNGKTTPPKPYTEDTLLAAMETAGAKDMPEGAERKGLGTPATRAGTIEKLVHSGFIERQKRQLVPTQKGINLVDVLPETVKSPLLTAEWEEKLKLVEHGNLPADDFMDSICRFTAALVKEHSQPVEEYKKLFAQPPGKTIGVCPRCGKDVTEALKGFFCCDKACGFALWKNNRFFENKGKKLDKAIATALLKSGRAKVQGFVSQKTGKPYAAVVVLEDTGKYINFKLEFPTKKG